MSDELPAVAGARVAGVRSSGTWGSALTADEFAAIRSAGFEPVGQVFGAAVHGIGPASGYGCLGAPGPSGGGSPPWPATQVSGEGAAGSFGPLVQAMAQARHTAVGRMITECAELGGHGVVGVRVSRGTFPLGGTQFTVMGTAVRALLEKTRLTLADVDLVEPEEARFGHATHRRIARGRRRATAGASRSPWKRTRGTRSYSEFSRFQRCWEPSW